MASNASSTVSSKLWATKLSVLSDKHLLFKINQHSWTLMFGLRMKMSIYLAFSLCCCRRSLSCQMNRVPGLFRSSRLGLEGDRGEEEADDGGPTSRWRLDLERKNKWERELENAGEANKTSKSEIFCSDSVSKKAVLCWKNTHFFPISPLEKLEMPVLLYCSPHYCQLHCWPRKELGYNEI